jgi:replicative DNA helicase
LKIAGGQVHGEGGSRRVTVTEFPGLQSVEGAPDRTPPQDMAAEQCVLGSMLMSKDAIADVVEVLRGIDFYRPAHETVYEAVLDLYGRGEPADAVTIAADLQRKNELGKVGGAPYLHTLMAMVPSAANAGYYAAIVREKAILRRLVEAGMKITQFGYAGDAEVDQLVDRAQAEIYSVTDKKSKEDYARLGEILEDTLDEIETIGAQGGQMSGVPTGTSDRDPVSARRWRSTRRCQPPPAGRRWARSRSVTCCWVPMAARPAWSPPPR